MALTRLTREDKAKLLAKVRAGHDLESACAELDVQPQVVRKDAALMDEVNEAFCTGTARLRARIFDGALKNGDLRILSLMLEERKAAQARIEVARPKVGYDREKLLTEMAKVLEQLVRRDPCKVLPVLLEVAVETGRLNGETVAAAEALRGLLLAHPALLYSPEWWKAELAERRNGMPAAVQAEGGGSVSGGPEVIPPRRRRRLEVLDEAAPLPSNRAPVVRGHWRDSPWSVGGE
jgi:hypothetical protein